MAYMDYTVYPGYAARPWLPTVIHVSVDHLSGTPVYLQLAAILRAAIERGEIEPDRPLPSYTTLMQEHGVARGTAAKAVQVLVNEGLVKIVPGRGAYVTRLDERPS
jgi:DNA-binding GntR family transcriptional regulator